MTTREPDDSQIEIALSALKRVVEIDGAIDGAKKQAQEEAQASS